MKEINVIFAPDRSEVFFTKKLIGLLNEEETMSKKRPNWLGGAVRFECCYVLITMFHFR